MKERRGERETGRRGESETGRVVLNATPLAPSPRRPVSPPSIAGDLRVVLWDIDGTLVRTRRQGVFKDYTTPALVRLFGTAGRLHELSVSGMTDLQIVSEALRDEGFTAEQISVRAAELAALYLEGLERLTRDEEVYHALPGARRALRAIEREPRYLNSLLTGNVEAEWFADVRSANGVITGQVTTRRTRAELLTSPDSPTKQRLARRLLREAPPVDVSCTAVLEQLSRSKRLALASSASAATIDLFLEVSKTRHLFEAVISADELPAAKPDPAIYAASLQRLGSAPAETAVVEDAPSGVRAALAAHIALVVGVEGTVSRESLLEAGALKVIHCLDDLLN